ncbi:MAG: M28 family peptidase [Flavobacteriales bacterium]|nr:M28 family peptidase [Flavobacteriales bacterium]
MLQRYLSVAGLAFLISAPAVLKAQDASIAGAISSVSIDSLVWDLERLTGEEPVDVGNGPETILSRNKFNAGNALAADWLQQRIAAMGYTPTVQAFGGSTGENVIAVKTGLVHPDRKVVICGHYDAMPGGPVNAPAADDDGSGTCSVLEAMRVLAPYSFENTIVFALWDEEEQGKVGSAYYAGVAAANDDTIAAVINMDAISYDGDGDGLMRIHARPTANSLAIKDTALMVNSTYGLNLNIAINNPGAVYSDHASFWTEGYGAILVIEDFDNDGNPHYHTPTDLLQYMDLPYWQGLTRLSIATTAVLAVPVNGPSTVAETTLPKVTSLSVYPNPAGQEAKLWFELRHAGRARITLADAMGRTVYVIEDGLLTSGAHQYELPTSMLSAGTYLVRVEAEGVSRTVRFVRTP